MEYIENFFELDFVSLVIGLTISGLALVFMYELVIKVMKIFGIEQMN